MAIKLHLPTGAPAYYEWLSTVIYVDDTSPIGLNRLLELNTKAVDDGLLPAELGQFLTSAGTLSSPQPWTDTAEAIADLTLRHEFCHYLQDIATGVGFSDELVFRSEFLNLVGMYSDKQDWQGLETLRADCAEKKLEQFQVFVPPKIEEKRKRARAEFLERRNIATLPGNDPRYLGIANLLEADAIAEVLIHTSSLLKQSRAATSLLFDENVVHLWNPHAMPPAYRAVFEDLRAVIMGNEHAVSAAGTADGAIGLLHFLGIVLQQLTDIALAYPPPSFFEDVPDDRRMYFDPVVKFYCCLSAFHQMNARAGKRMVEWLDGALDFQTALFTDSEYADIYPDRKAIYAAWQEVFDKISGDDVMMRARKRVAKTRQTANVSVRRSPLQVDFIQGGGLWWWNSSRLPVSVFTTDIDSVVDVRKTRGQLMVRISDLRLLDHLCNGKVMFCPFIGKDCEGETAICRSGFDDVKNLPKENCVLRHRYAPVCG
ncbi:MULTISPECIES: hypothetical protein [unclassified Bradyrhizobium]|uniref:hypothetical protein n=1 Tax=unclassified Bradyrhizobium TaxID=2631580 RepID=UPI00291664DF|nr:MULTISPECIES: hypothetical protein [unclassified Bradyrhizobium]